jgi:ATP-binding cassette, subfamily B, bacterial
MKSIWRIIRYTSELKRYYIIVSVFTILVAMMTQLAPLLTKGAVDEITRGINVTEINIVIVLLFVAAIFVTELLQTLLSNINGYYGDILSAKLRKLLSARYYDHVLKLPQRYFDTELTGTIINRLSRGTFQIADFVQMMSNNFLQFIFSTIFTLIIVAYYSWPVALLLLSLYPVYIWMTARTSKKWQKWQTEINENLDMASGRFAESISQVKVVKSFVREAQEVGLFSKYLSNVIWLTRPQSRYWHTQDIWRRIVLAIILFFVYGIIFVQAARGVYTIGETILLIQYTQLIRIPLFSISYLVDRTQRAIADSRDYFAVMDEPTEKTKSSGSKHLEVSGGDITFSGVYFAYDKDEPVLEQMTFTIRPQNKVALVGESGGGKTTVTNLLLRLYDPSKGHISIDGQDISMVDGGSVRENIGVVFQEPVLFSGSIKENIAYGLPAASEQQIMAAAKAANAHEFISKFEKKYDTEIGERGLKLSGGQKQRIAIARALLKNAPILILDEATSSLDSKSERLVQQALERLMRGRTTIIIAHRLSTIRSVDQIITVDNGRVDEIGTPAELSRSGGIYQKLLELQQNHTETTKKQLEKYDIASD